MNKPTSLVTTRWIWQICFWVALSVYGSGVANADPSRPKDATPGSTDKPGPTLSGTTVTLNWKKVSKAKRYELRIRDLSKESDKKEETSATSYNMTVSAGRQYRWRVRACDSRGCSKFTEWLYFQTPPPAGGNGAGNQNGSGGQTGGGSLLPAPSLAEPPSGAGGVSATPRFSWSSVAGANRYWLMVATSRGALPTDPAATSCGGCAISGTTSITNHTLPAPFPNSSNGGKYGALQSNTTYYWQVMAWNSSSNTWGKYSEIRSFTTTLPLPKPTGTNPGSTSEQSPPQLKSPVTLSWNAVSGAARYELGIRNTVTGELIGAESSSSSYTATLKDGKYRWNVRACDAQKQRCSDWTDPLFFQIQTPTQGGNGAGSTQGPKVVLLLHGMNSKPETWNDFVGDSLTLAILGIHSGFFSGSCPVIFAGKIQQTATPNTSGTLCYRIRFGEYDDKSSRTGLESAKGDNTGLLSAGDFSTFNQLGQEVAQAVSAIIDKDRHPGARIVLVGHSRGGLAARAFIQNEVLISQPTRILQSVVGLITTGTPHLGSPLGRIYNYLYQYPREYCNGYIKDSFCADDWEVVNLLLDRSRGCALLPVWGVKGPQLDVRRPTINDLSDRSSSISILNSNSRLLQYGNNIKYGQLRHGQYMSDGAYSLGRLHPTYSLFKIEHRQDNTGLPTDGYCDQLSDAARDSILLDYPQAKVMGAIYFKGDGTVPYTSQAFPAGVSVNAETIGRGAVLHTEEPGRLADIQQMFTKLGFVGWLGK